MKNRIAFPVLLFLFMYTHFASGQCQPASKLAAPWTQVKLSADQKEMRVCAEASTADSRFALLLYSRRVSLQSSPRDWSLHLAALDRSATKPILVFDQDLTLFAPGLIEFAASEPSPTQMNTFVVSGGYQGIHIPLRVRTIGAKDSTSASDLILVILEDGRLQPVLHLANTSESSDRGTTRESELLTFGDKNQITEVLWITDRFSALQVIQASARENTLYQWGERGFRKFGTVSEDELTERLKTGQKLARAVPSSTPSDSGITLSIH